MPQPAASPTAIVADDERLMRDQLIGRLKEAWPELEIVGEATNGSEAVALVQSEEPDIVFLDIQMPGMDGIQAAKALAGQAHIVFVTAYDQYAIRAFAAAALDYLLKPVDDDRLSAALTRVREALAGRDAQAQRDRLLALLGEITGRPALRLDEALDARACELGGEAPLAFRDGQRIVRVAPAEICWIDAAGDYMCIHTERETHVLRATMRELEQRLDPRRFPRIHRSILVNAARVTALRPHHNGEYFLTLDCGQELKLSRSYRDRLALFR